MTETIQLETDFGFDDRIRLIIINYTETVQLSFSLFVLPIHDDVK